MAVQSTTSTSSIDPALLPFLTQGLERAQSLFLTGEQPAFYPGQTYVSPSAQTTEALAQQEALARQNSQLLGQAQQSFLSGLTAQSQAAPLYQNIYGQAGTQAGANVYGQAAGGGFVNPATRMAQNLYGQAGAQPGESTYQQAAQGRLPVAGQQQLQGLFSKAGIQPGQEVFSTAAGGGLQNITTGALANIASGSMLNSNPYQQQMIQAATRPLTQQFGEQVLPGISSLYSKSGRLGSGSMERALGTATESYGRALGDVTSNLAGSQYQAERQLQQSALGQLAGVSAQDIQTQLSGAGALEQAQRAATAQQAGIAGQLAGLSAQDIQTRLAGAGGLQSAQAQALAQQSGLIGQIGGLSQQDVANRLAGATGLQASQQAQLGTQLQAAGGLGTVQAQDLARQLQASLAAPQIYGQQYLPSQMLGQVGAQQEAISSQALQDQMARYNFQQQLPYQQLQGYLSSVYGSPMGSYGTQTTQQPTYNNTTTNALTGALAGGLGGYALNQAFNFGSPVLSAGLGAAAGGLLGGFL